MWIYLYLFCLALLCFLNQNISVSQQFWESLSDSLFKNILSPFFLSTEIFKWERNGEREKEWETEEEMNLEKLTPRTWKN